MALREQPNNHRGARRRHAYHPYRHHHRDNNHQKQNKTRRDLLALHHATICLSVGVSICAVCLFVHLSVCPFGGFILCLSVRPSVCMSTTPQSQEASRKPTERNTISHGFRDRTVTSIHLHEQIRRNNKFSEFVHLDSALVGILAVVNEICRRSAQSHNFRRTRWKKPTFEFEGPTKQGTVEPCWFIVAPFVRGRTNEAFFFLLCFSASLTHSLTRPFVLLGGFGWIECSASFASLVNATNRERHRTTTRTTTTTTKDTEQKPTINRHQRHSTITTTTTNNKIIVDNNT